MTGAKEKKKEKGGNLRRVPKSTYLFMVTHPVVGGYQLSVQSEII